MQKIFGWVIYAARKSSVLHPGWALHSLAWRGAGSWQRSCIVARRPASKPGQGDPSGGRFAALLELEVAGWEWQTDGRAADSSLAGVSWTRAWVNW